MLDPSQFNTDRTYPGRWTVTFSNPPINMFVPTTIVELAALMTDLEMPGPIRAKSAWPQPGTEAYPMWPASCSR